MDDEGFRPPSRERFREERRALRAADRRRKMVGVPAVLLGIGLVVAGAWVFISGESGETPTNVGGTVVERTTTTTSTTTTTTSTTTTTLPPTTLPPTTVAPTTTAKPRPRVTPAPTTAAPAPSEAADVPVETTPPA